MQKSDQRSQKAIVIGASAGGLKAITTILRSLPESYKTPILIVQHISPRSDNFWIKNLNDVSTYRVKEAEEKELIENGVVYISPSNYHLLVERDKTLSLSADEKVNFSRPSIDVLFESAAEVYKENLIGILLTGASKDGAMGMKAIKDHEGITIVQDPSTAESSLMPESAIAATKIDYVLPVDKIGELLLKLNREERKNS